VDALAEPQHTVAILVANPALSSILSMTLAGVSSLRVRPFDTQLALTTYLRLAPADLVVAVVTGTYAKNRRTVDSESPVDIIGARELQVIALASALTPETKMASIHAGIDEIIMKPMSPRYLVERVLARLPKKRAAPGAIPRSDRRASLRKRDWSSFGDNVVPLVRRQPQLERPL